MIPALEACFLHGTGFRWQLLLLHTGYPVLQSDSRYRSKALLSHCQHALESVDDLGFGPRWERAKGLTQQSAATRDHGTVADVT